jgi:hypothetical protein
MKKVAAAQITFGTYVSRWYAALDLAASTMQNYWRRLVRVCGHLVQLVVLEADGALSVLVHPLREEDHATGAWRGAR